MKKLLFAFALLLCTSGICHSQTVDIIITKTGKNLYGEIIEEQSGVIVFTEHSSSIEKNIDKSQIKEVIRGYRYEDLSDAVYNELNPKGKPQDYIIRTDGDSLSVNILSVTPEKIVYIYPFENEDLKREIDRSQVDDYYQSRKKDNFSVKKDKMETPAETRNIDFQDQYMEEVIYVQNRMQLIKFNFTALGLGSISLAYEHSLGKNKSLEIVASQHGLGLNNTGGTKEGFGAEIGYKFKMGNIFSEYYLPDHLLSGTYIKPILGFASVNETIETFNPNNTFVFENKNRNYGYLGFDLGYQWIFSDLISMDIYTGMAYYNGEFEVTINNDGDIRETNDNFFDEGDFFASGNFGAKAGFKIGILFGSKTKYKSER
jgi:hypothetical protein